MRRFVVRRHRRRGTATVGVVFDSTLTSPAVEGPNPMPTDTTEDGDATAATLDEAYRVDPDDAGDFLVDLGERLRTADDVVLSGDGWDLSFTYRDPVDVELEYVGGSDATLAIELELRAPADVPPPTFD
jgi:amphi-Trp domain-containing protein